MEENNERIEELEKLKRELNEISVEGEKKEQPLNKEEKTQEKPLTLVRKPNSMSYKGFISTVLLCAVSTVVGIVAAAFIIISRL